ncbi:hypothetical protein ACIQU6_30630 [Streptomyces sp. NPDC090442]|uniref:hypothetical protein n=1 Tax=Streptomyces sp. NPDC090442 TaxID=3365962 RepID=UPI00382F532B
MSVTWDGLTANLSTEQLLALKRELHLGQLRFMAGDRVAAAVPLRGSTLDEDLELEEGDGQIPYSVPAGTPGRVHAVRGYVSPFPYRVTWDTGLELSVAEHQLVQTRG